MVVLTELWLPILMSSVLLFIVSGLVWMVLPHHKKDWPSIPNGERVQEALRGVPPGQYVYPKTMADIDRKDPAARKQFENGWGMVLVKDPGVQGMGPALAMNFVQFLFVTTLVAYLTGLALPAGAEYGAVFRVAGTAAILGHCGALMNNSIWWGHTWKFTLKQFADCAVYGLITAGVFGWLWP